MLKKLALAIFVFLVVIFLAAQLIRPDLTNPPVEAAMTIDGHPAIPPEVKPIFKKACADCHTHETKYPWYANVTPVNWWLKDHIDEGRRHMNLSVDIEGVDEICKEVTREKMPLPSYTWGHPEAVLTAQERQALCSWSKSAEGAGEGGGESAAPSAKGGSERREKEGDDDDR